MKRCYACMSEYQDDLEQCPNCHSNSKDIYNEEYHLAIGSILLGRFIVGKALGYGGFGTTYLGWDTVLDKKIAIKEYLPSELATRFPHHTAITIFTGEKEDLFMQGKMRFLEEARKLAMFNHEDSIITVYDEFEANNTAYLVMEYYEGETLASKIERDGIFTSDEVKEIMVPLLESLQEVHDKGIVHRDIAPDNIYLTTDHKVKLLDFGAARNTYSNQTTSISIIIKRGYAPEEQYRTNGALGPWSDVYGLCATMYYMLTGIVPMDAIERGDSDIIAPIDIVPTIDRNLNAAILNGLIFDYRQRTQDVKTLKKEITSKKRVKIKRVKEVVKPYRLSSRTKALGSLTSGVIVVLCTLLVLGVIASNSLHYGSRKVLASSQTYVPGLLNADVEQARELIDDANLQMVVVDKLDDPDVRANLVVSQNPKPGSIVAQDSKIRVVVSRGPEHAIVPDVSYQYQEQAIKTLEEAGFNVTCKVEKNKEVANNVVFKQNINANTSCPKKTEIELTVSKNSSSVGSITTLEDITDLSLLEAKDRIYKQGLYIAVVERQVQTRKEENTILNINNHKNEYRKGDIIEVIISTKKPKQIVPDVEFKNIDEADKILKDKGLKTKFVYQENQDIEPDKIFKQQVEPNSIVNTNDIITLYVSKVASVSNHNNNIVVNNDKEDVVEEPVIEEQPEVTRQWSNWTTDAFLKDNPDYDVEEKTQYAYYHVIDKKGTTPLSIDNYQVVTSKPTGEYTDWSSWSEYISGKAPSSSNSIQYSETENLYRYFQYACNSCGNAGYCFPWPGYLCGICDSECSTYLTRDVWNISAEMSIKYTLKMKNGLTHPAVHYLGNYNDDWFYLPEQYVIDQRYKKRTREMIYVYHYRSLTTSKWTDDKPKIGVNDELTTRKVYRYKIKDTQNQ